MPPGKGDWPWRSECTTATAGVPCTLRSSGPDPRTVLPLQSLPTQDSGTLPATGTAYPLVDQLSKYLKQSFKNIHLFSSQNIVSHRVCVCRIKGWSQNTVSPPPLPHQTALVPFLP